MGHGVSEGEVRVGGGSCPHLRLAVVEHVNRAVGAHHQDGFVVRVRHEEHGRRDRRVRLERVRVVCGVIVRVWVKVTVWGRVRVRDYFCSCTVAAGEVDGAFENGG